MSTHVHRILQPYRVYEIKLTALAESFIDRLYYL